MSRLGRLFSFLAAILLVTTSLYASELVDRVVAIVNGEIITLFEVNDNLAKLLKKNQGIKIDPADPQYDQFRRQLLDNMINDLLLKQEASRLNLSITDTEVQAQISDIKKKNGMNEQQFNAQLAREGLTRKEFEDNLRMESLRKRIIGYMVNRKILITDDEIARFMADNGGQLPAPTTLSGKTIGNIGFIMVPTMKEAGNIRAMIQNKELTFSDAAKKFSLGPGREQGGFLGDVTINDLAPELREALQSVSKGEVTQPVGLDGKAVLLIDKPKGDAAQAAPAKQPEKSPAPSVELSPELRDQVYETLYKKKFDKLFQEYMEKLRNKSVVDIRY